MPQLAERMQSTDAMVALFAPAATIRRMLEVEAALAMAQARVGLVPMTAAKTIGDVARSLEIEPDDLAARGRRASALAIPLVEDLSAAVAARDPAAAEHVHRGGTSQDIIDTALVLQLGDALALLDADLAAVDAALADQARRHAATVMLGRTLMQPATPITFGLKAAGWCAAVRRGRARLAETGRDALVLQFGGAVGTLAALGADGLAVADALGAELGLAVPAAPWHAHRDRLAALGAAVGISVGSLGKIARDVSMLMQPEIAEVLEPAGEGRGGSSAMPHKRNPSGAMLALAAAARAPHLAASLIGGLVQEHERALGPWQAEAVTLPALMEAAAGAAGAMREVADGLIVDAAAMRRNLDAMGGLVYSELLTARLAERTGRPAARVLVKELIEAAVADGRNLKDVAAADARVTDELDANALESVFDPLAATGSSKDLIDRLLAEG